MNRFGERAILLSGIAAQALGWKPDEFWNATPAELAAALSDPQKDEDMTGDVLHQLMARFPDRMI